MLLVQILQALTIIGALAFVGVLYFYQLIGIIKKDRDL